MYKKCSDCGKQAQSKYIRCKTCFYRHQARLENETPLFSLKVNPELKTPIDPERLDH